MLCRNCWDETWEGVRCKTCGTNLLRQKSLRLRLHEAREREIKRAMAWAFGLGLLVILAWTHTVPEMAFYSAALSGVLIAFYLTTVGALDAYEEGFECFWETYGPGVRYLLGTGGQVLAACLRREGLTNFLIIECAVIFWSLPLYAVLGSMYDVTCPLTMYGAGVFGWFCSSFIRREWY